LERIDPNYKQNHEKPKEFSMATSPKFLLNSLLPSFKKSSKIFGTPLKEIMMRADHAGRSIPIVVEDIFKFLRTKGEIRFWVSFSFPPKPLVWFFSYYVACKGLDTEGLFRISGSQNQVSQLAKEYDEGLKRPLLFAKTTTDFAEAGTQFRSLKPLGQEH
jgi:hypothetical protein